MLCEDSNLMRLLLTEMLREAPEVDLVGVAKNGKEAVEVVQKTQPDVLILDMVMEKYDGHYALSQLAALYPLPVLLLSGLKNIREEDLEKYQEAMPVAFLPKPQGNYGRDPKLIEDRLLHEIKQLTSSQRFDNVGFAPQLVMVAGSSGAQEALEEILSNLASPLPFAVVIAQHSRTGFLENFVQKLSKTFRQHTFHFADKASPLTSGFTFLSCKYNWEIQNRNLVPTSRRHAVHNFPSADLLFSAGAETFGQEAWGIVLSGMGKDGTAGSEKIFSQNGQVIVQNRETCAVYGMPQSAYQRGIVSHVLPPKDIAKLLQEAAELSESF